MIQPNAFQPGVSTPHCSPIGALTGSEHGIGSQRVALPAASVAAASTVTNGRSV